MALSTSIGLNITATLAKAFDLATGSQVPFTKAVAMTWASGVAANQADKVFADQRSTATTDSLDVATAGGLLDAYGDAFAIARLKALIVVAAGANGADLRITRPAAGVPWLGATGDFVVVRPGGSLWWFAPDATGVAVTATTADLIDIVSASGTLTFDIIIIGASA